MKTYIFCGFSTHSIPAAQQIWFVWRTCIQFKTHNFFLLSRKKNNKCVCYSQWNCINFTSPTQTPEISFLSVVCLCERIWSLRIIAKSKHEYCKHIYIIFTIDWNVYCVPRCFVVYVMCKYVLSLNDRKLICGSLTRCLFFLFSSSVRGLLNRKESRESRNPSPKYEEKEKKNRKIDSHWFDKIIVI